MLVVLLPGMAAFGQSTPVSEYALKSALLFKLPLFVYRQDTEKNAPVAMCLLGNNPFGNAIEKLAQASIEGRNVRYQRIAAPAEATGCEFLFVSRSEAAALDAVLRRLGTLPVVTVSDIEGFARAGGMVEFALGAEGAAVSILINRRVSQKHGIEFNAQLLRIAKVIE